MTEDASIWAWLFYLSQWAIRIVMLFIIPVRRPPAAAKTWLLLVLFLPWIGLLLFWLVGSKRLPRWRIERIERLREVFGPIRRSLDDDPACAHPKLTSDLRQAVTLAENLGQLPILGGNQVQLINDYDGTVDALIADVDAARHHVHILFYIVADDKTGRRVIEALGRATRRGVQCRLMADSVGSRGYLSGLYRLCAEAGVCFEEAMPVGLFRWKAARLDLRNHRKIAVIDGRVGYTGSQNLVDAQFKEDLTFEEMMVRVTGPVVLELQYVFVGDWFLETEEALDGPDYFPEPERAGPVAAQTMPSGPGYPTENYHRLIVALLHGADKQVYITTPYFVPDEPLLQAMQTAVLRGVAVHLVVSQKTDFFLVTLAQQSYYGQMLEDGIKIHVYRKKFLHAKHISVDDELALIGSSNVDIRSFVLNGEISLIFYDADVTRRLHAEEQGYLVYCDELSAEGWDRRPWMMKLVQRMARLLSPLL